MSSSKIPSHARCGVHAFDLSTRKSEAEPCEREASLGYTARCCQKTVSSPFQPLNSSPRSQAVMMDHLPIREDRLSDCQGDRSLSFFLNYYFIHMFIHCWVISPPCPLPHSLPTSPPQFQAGPVLPLSLILLKKRHKLNKEDKALLLVELRIATQKYS
jgi:hypothetical protein